MRKEMIAMILILILSLGAAQYLEETKGRDFGRGYAWWSLTYERPNPQKLPVKVRFRWLPVKH